MKNLLYNAEQIQKLLLSVGENEAFFQAGSTIILQGEIQKNVFFLYRGKAHASRTDAEGRAEDYAVLSEGDFFGDVLALSEQQKSPVSVFADTDCAVISFPYEALLHTDNGDANLLLHLLLNSLVERFFSQQRRIGYLTRPNLREKILAYLHDTEAKEGSNRFTIPFDRDALAAFLFCDRSALSRELSSMKKDGLIDYSKNHFIMLNSHFSKKD